MILHLEKEFRQTLRGEDSFDALLRIEGRAYREMADRRTLRFERGGRAYFIKAHFGVGWAEIFKNLASLRLPVLGARNEVRAIKRLEEIGVGTMKIAAYGWRGCNPATRESFVVTEDLGNTVTLEDFCRDWPASPPAPALKRALIEKVANIARTLHGNGVNHRDFYLCHFHVPASAPLGDMKVIDLHRAQLRGRTPRRWVVKDVGGLYFSAMDIGLTRRDLLRFIRAYSGRPLRAALHSRSAFWRAVEAKATDLYRSWNSKEERS
jgi:heptose I phosphotransferase